MSAAVFPLRRKALGIGKPEVGRTYSLLTVLEIITPRGRLVKVRCACGVEKVVKFGHIRRGAQISCGRMRGSVTHGATRGRSTTPEWRSWNHIRQRCLNPDNDQFYLYGGRGIKICEQWAQFETFLADMGPRPSVRHSIDRYPNINGNYEPGNCRWANPREQAENRRTTSRVTINGETHSMTEWSRRLNIPPHRTLTLVRNGVDPVEAIRSLTGKVA